MSLHLCIACSFSISGIQPRGFHFGAGPLVRKHMLSSASDSHRTAFLRVQYGVMVKDIVQAISDLRGAVGGGKDQGIVIGKSSANIVPTDGEQCYKHGSCPPMPIGLAHRWCANPLYLSPCLHPPTVSSSASTLRRKVQLVGAECLSYLQIDGTPYASCSISPTPPCTCCWYQH